MAVTYLYQNKYLIKCTLRPVFGLLCLIYKLMKDCRASCFVFQNKLYHFKISCFRFQPVPIPATMHSSLKGFYLSSVVSLTRSPRLADKIILST